MLTADNQRRNYAAFDVTEVSEQHLKCANFSWKANGLLSEGGSGRGSKAHWRQGRDGLARRHRSRTTCRHCAPCTFGATRLLAWSALVHAAKTAGRWIGADVANVGENRVDLHEKRESPRTAFFIIATRTAARLALCKLGIYMPEPSHY